MVSLSYLSPFGLSHLPWEGSVEWAGPSHISQQLGKCPTDMPSGQSGGSSSTEITSSQVCLGLCRVDKNHDCE